MSSKLFIAGGLVAATLQTGWLGLMIEDRAALLRTGQEVLLASGMIDPRDIFRGHYVTLRLEIERLDRTGLSFDPQSVERGDTIWAVLEPTIEQGAPWHVASLHATLPSTDAPVIRGKFQGNFGERINIDFPIDRYFAPKDRALELEAARQESELGVILALSADGTAAIKGISVDGTRVYDEPLY